MQYIQPTERIIMLLILIIFSITFNLSVSTPVHISVFHRKIDMLLISLEENTNLNMMLVKDNLD